MADDSRCQGFQVGPHHGPRTADLGGAHDLVDGGYAAAERFEGDVEAELAAVAIPAASSLARVSGSGFME